MFIKNRPFQKGYKYRIYPTLEQQQHLTQVFGCCRYVYNALLYRTQLDYEVHSINSTIYPKPNVSKFGFCSILPLFKREFNKLWLNNVAAQVLQQSVMCLADAYTHFFKRGYGYPKYKHKYSKQSAIYGNQIYKIKNNKLYLSKLDTPIKVKWDRPLPPNRITSCTISRTSSGKYYASFLCEYIPTKTQGTGIIGIDAGITDLITMSDGSSIPNPRHYVNTQRKLARLQRRLSRKQKGSKNRNKARLKVARCHERIANQRNDLLHKLTTRLVRDNQAIAIESLNVTGMVKNRRLSKHILDAGWGLFRQYLQYKCHASQHCYLFLADPYYPSTQLCSVCGSKPVEKVKLGVKSWICSKCGSQHHRDHNAAINLEILADSMLTQGPYEEQVVLCGPYIPYIKK